MTLPERKGAALIGACLVDVAQTVPEHTVVVGLFGEREPSFPEHVHHTGVPLNDCTFVLFENLCYTCDVFFREVDISWCTGTAVSAPETFELKPMFIKTLWLIAAHEGSHVSRIEMFSHDTITGEKVK